MSTTLSNTLRFKNPCEFILLSQMQIKYQCICNIKALPGVLARGTGESGIYFRGAWEQRPHFEWNRGTKTILGNREHIKKTNFRFLGTGEQANLFQGNRYPLGGPQY